MYTQHTLPKLFPLLLLLSTLLVPLHTTQAATTFHQPPATQAVRRELLQKIFKKNKTMSTNANEETMISTLKKAQNLTWNAKVKGYTLAHLAADKGDTELFQLMESKGLKTSSFFDSKYEKWSPLHLAAYHGNHQIVKKLLLLPKITLNARTDERATPLILAAYKSRDNVLKVFLDYKENPQGRKKLQVGAKDIADKKAIDYYQGNDQQIKRFLGSKTPLKTIKTKKTTTSQTVLPPSSTHTQDVPEVVTENPSTENGKHTLLKNTTKRITNFQLFIILVGCVFFVTIMSLSVKRRRF